MNKVVYRINYYSRRFDDEFVNLLSLKEFPEPSEIAKIAEEMAAFQGEEYAVMTQDIFGVDLFSQNPALKKKLEKYARNSAKLISKQSTATKKTVAEIVAKGFEEGKLTTAIAGDIAKATGVDATKAEVWARDQLAKVATGITKEIQTGLGISTYIWSTSGDSEVRTSHEVLEGMICSWDDPSVYKEDHRQSWQPRSLIGAVELHPGEDYNCRCTAQPDVERLIYE